MSKSKAKPGQILLFPGNHETHAQGPNLPPAGQGESRAAQPIEVVLSGTYRKDFEGLRRIYEQLRDLGCEVLSPSNVEATREADGFVYMRGEEAQAPVAIETKHLDAIQRSRFVWLHAPDGYVGPTAALEVGFARAIGVPVFAERTVSDAIVQSFVQVAASAEEVVNRAKTDELPVPSPAIQAFQHYYRRAATQRGYGKESARDCLLLMVEEVGELARAIRARGKLVRHGTPISAGESRELADVFLYVIHMANILDLDLAKAIQGKEFDNLRRYLAQAQP